MLLGPLTSVHMRVSVINPVTGSFLAGYVRLQA
jgi:hypothetical protein